jgi:hypothetical protein
MIKNKTLTIFFSAILTTPCATLCMMTLFKAAEQGSLAQVKTLLHMGNINSYDVAGYTPLIRAIKGCHYIRQRKTPHENDVGNGVIHYLVEQCADVNLTSRSLSTLPGDCPLYFTITHNNTVAANSLLRAGASPNKKTSTNETLLTLAMRYNRADIVQRLLAHKASVEEVDNNAKNPLEVALSYSNIFGYQMVSIIESLIAAKTNVHYSSPNTSTILLYALHCLYMPASLVVENDALSVVEKLTRAGAQLAYKKGSANSHKRLLRMLCCVADDEEQKNHQEKQQIEDLSSQEPSSDNSPTMPLSNDLSDSGASLTDGDDDDQAFSPANSTREKPENEEEDELWEVVDGEKD